MEQLFRKYLRSGQHWNKKLISLTDAKWQELQEDTFIEQWQFTKGSKFKMFETSNFGWIVFDKDATLVNGATPIKRMFKY